MVHEYGLHYNVQLVDKYLDFDEVVSYLAATDIYLTPYLNPAQIVSGTLAYAVGCGKAIVSTPYLYAQELLAHNRGFLCEFRDAASIAQRLNMLLDDPALRRATERRAYRFGRQMTWPHVAAEYGDLFSELVSARAARAGDLCLKHEPLTARPPLDHLVALSDDVGVIQHALENVPNRKTGYCTDDVARAFIVALAHLRARAVRRRVARLASIYLAFLQHAQLDDGRFHNFMGYDRRWLDEVGTHDSCGRAIWALGYGVANAPTQTWRRVCATLLDRALPSLESLGVHPLARLRGARARARVRRCEGRRSTPTALRYLAGEFSPRTKQTRSHEWRGSKRS